MLNASQNLNNSQQLRYRPDSNQQIEEEEQVRGKLRPKYSIYHNLL